jgi:hypothetical protein
MSNPQYLENPDLDQKRIEELKDEFYDWWFEQFRKSAYQPTIFEWILINIQKRDKEIRAIKAAHGYRKTQVGYLIKERKELETQLSYYADKNQNQ